MKKEKINEEVLCVLRKNETTNQIEIGYLNIENPFSQLMDKFSTLCDNPDSTLKQITNFIGTTKQLDQLNAHYRYCKSLSGSYQAFTASNKDAIKEINDREQWMLLNKRENPDKYDLEKNVTELKEEIKHKYILWSKAFAINKSYRLCHEDKSILTFSHRIDGWSNPSYQLTSNFSVELKTNFGYGRASYFYTKLKYKNIEITPFSEWIDYEFAKFSEIVRYTQSHILRNEYWQEAMEFSRDACNLSMSDEQKFVEKYVIEECEIMVSGLEELFNKEQFSFKTRQRSEYTVDKKGHILIEFRGEKISGALNFITKILEFEGIASIDSFIQRIESCNKRIQPILVDEAKVIKVKIVSKTKERDELKPKYDLVLEKNRTYNEKKVLLKKQMIANGQLNPQSVDIKKLDTQFETLNPEFKEFTEEYKKVTESYRILNEQIQNFTQIRDNIISYDEKINEYFKK